MKTSYSKTFYTLGYAFAPIFIIGGLSHLLHSFFLHTASDITNGFIQAFALPFDAMEPLATRKDKWLYIFGAFNYIAAIWAFIIMFGRIRLMESKTTLKVIAFPFAAAFIIFYLWLNFYKGYVFKTYGMNRGGHAHHGQSKEQLFQSVAPNKAVLLQEGEGKNAGANCGMQLTRFYKTNHAATLNGVTKQYCSMHCLAEALYVKQLPLENIRVVAVDTLQFIDANSAYYVVGSHKAGTMTKTSKYAFADKKAATQFAQENGGTLMNFQTAMEQAIK